MLKQVNLQSGGDMDAMIGVTGIDDLGFEDGSGGSPVQKEQWSMIENAEDDATGSKGIFKPTAQNVINIDFTDTLGSEVKEGGTGREEEHKQFANQFQDLGSSIDSTPNNDQNDVRFMNTDHSPTPLLIAKQTQVLQTSSELLQSSLNQHKTIVQLSYSPKTQIKVQSKQIGFGPTIMSHGIVSQSQNAQKLHQYSQLIQKASIGGIKVANFNCQLKVNPESSSAPTVVSQQEQSVSKPQLSSIKKSGITSSIITKSSILNTSSNVALRRSHVSAGMTASIQDQRNKKSGQKQLNQTNSEIEGDYQAIVTASILQSNASSFLHNIGGKPQQSIISITPGQVIQKASFHNNTQMKQGSVSTVTAGKTSPRLQQNSGSYSILARQRSQNNRLQTSASQPQIFVQQPMIIHQQQISSDNSSRSGKQQQQIPDFFKIEQDWYEIAQLLLDEWAIPFQAKNAYTRLEVLDLIQSVKENIIKPLSQQSMADQNKAAQYQAQSKILEEQIERHMANHREIQENIIQVRSQFSQHEEILKKMDECKNELKQLMLNTMMCLDFYRDLDGYITQQRFKSQSQEVIKNLNDIETLMQQHGLLTIEFDIERIENLAESIQDYVRSRYIDKKVININIGDDFDEQKYTSNTIGDNFIFSPTGQGGAPSLYSGEDSNSKGSLQVKITRLGNHQSRLQSSKQINKSATSQEHSSNRTSSAQNNQQNHGGNRHLNGGCCGHSNFQVPIKQTTAQDELKLKNAIITRLREQLEHKLKKILALKQELRSEREDAMKTDQLQRLQESLIRMEHDYNTSVVRNNKLTIEVRELKAQIEEMHKETAKARNNIREQTKTNREMRKVIEGKQGFKELEEAVAQMTLILVSKRNEVLSSEQREQIRAIFGNSIVIQKLKYKIHQQEENIFKVSSYLSKSIKLNHQYKELIDFQWPLLRLTFQAIDINAVKAKFDQIWKSADSFSSYYSKEIEARSIFLRDLKKEIAQQKFTFQTDHPGHYIDLLKDTQTKNQMQLEEADSQIWYDMTALRREYAQSNIGGGGPTTTKARKARDHFSSDAKLLQTQESLNNKFKILNIEEEYQERTKEGKEDSLLLNDDLNEINQLMSPFAEDQKIFNFNEGEESIRNRASGTPGTKNKINTQNIDKQLRRTDFPDYSNHQQQWTGLMETPTILINNQCYGEFKTSEQKDQDTFANYALQLKSELQPIELNNTAEDLKSLRKIDVGLASHDDEVNSFFKCGSNPVLRTSKKILKEKLRNQKNRNTELVSNLRELQKRIAFLEEKERARNHSVSSEHEKNNFLLGNQINDAPQVFKQSFEH